VLAAALAARPEIAQLDHQLDQARYRIAAARAGRRPQVSLSGVAEYRAPNRNGEYGNFSDPGLKTYSLTALAEVTLPLLDGGLVDSRVAQQDAERIALEARRRDAGLAVEREVRQALSDWRVAAAEYASNEARIRWAREAVHLAQAAYKGGTGTATDVRDAEAALANAQADAARAVMDYWFARAELDHATGSSATGKER
jgi:outer membrane protein TolC